MAAILRIILIGGLVFGGTQASSQFANFFEIQATAMAEVNFQVAELNSEKKFGSALAVVAKAISNLEKQSSLVPNSNPTTVFEISFDDAISLKLKSKISAGELFNFQLLLDASKQQIVQALEQKYSAAFFEMALQMRRFQLHHAIALSLAAHSDNGISKNSTAAEAKVFEEIVKAISHPFLLKNSNSGITYVFDLADVLNSSVGKTAISTEYASINSRLVDLYIDVAEDSKNSILVALKNSKKQKIFTSKLFSEVQIKKAEAYKLVMASEGNKLHVQ